MTTTDLVEWLNSFSRKARNHHRGFEFQKLVSLFFVEEIDFRFCFRVFFSWKFYVGYMTHVNAPNLFHSTPRPLRPYRYSKDAREITAAGALGKWDCSGIAWACGDKTGFSLRLQLRHRYSLWPKGLRNFTVLNSNRWRINRNKKTEKRLKKNAI